MKTFLNRRWTTDRGRCYFPAAFARANTFCAFFKSGMSKPEVEQAVFWDAVTLSAMTQWRKVHIPIFIVFTVLALGHIISVFMFWGWA